MAFELIVEWQLGRFDLVSYLEGAGAVAANPADTLAQFFEQLVVFVIGLGEFGRGLSACAVEDDLHVAAALDVLKCTGQPVHYTPKGLVCVSPAARIMNAALLT